MICVSLYMFNLNQKAMTTKTLKEILLASGRDFVELTVWLANCKEMKKSSQFILSDMVEADVAKWNEAYGVTKYEVKELFSDEGELYVGTVTHYL